MIRYFFIVLLLSSQYAYSRTQYLDEFLADDSIEDERMLILLKYSYKVNEVENDKIGDSADKNFKGQQETLAFEYNFSNSSQLRIWTDYAHSFSGISQGSLINDPTLSYWRRLKGRESPQNLTGDIGIEMTLPP